MEKKLNFEAKDAKVVEVVFANNKFCVPRYQRPYAWNEEEISEFWNDLHSNKDPYFIGNLIFNYEPYKKTGYIDIIDGQQRLLTITIFIAVLRDIAKTINPKIAEMFQKQDIEFQDRSGKESFRIKPGDSTKVFFEKYIQKNNNNISKSIPQTKEEKTIKKNYEYLYTKTADELEKFDNKEKKIESLELLRDKIAELIVINIKIDSEEDAYEIFETTNARGIDLSVGDLLKNLIFKKIREEGGRDLAKESWQEILSRVQATNTEIKRFIRYFWLSKYSFVTEKKLFKEIKKEITDWEELLKGLHASSILYNQLLEGNEEDFANIKNGHKIYQHTFSIRLMGVSQCHVLLMCILRNLKKLDTDPTRIFKLIERFTFQYSAVCKLPGNKVEKIYSKFALKIEKTLNDTTKKKISGKINSIFSELEKELKDERPSFETFKESFINISYKNSEQSRKMIKYVLKGIDTSYRKTPEEKIDFNNVNIEHILPQNPHRDWKLKKKEIKGYVNKLGNLTLLSKKLNSKVQNHVIKEKIKSLGESRLPVTVQLVKELNTLKNKWNESEITKRQVGFSKLAYNKIWDF